MVVASVWPALPTDSVTVKVTRSIPPWSGRCVLAKTRQLKALPRLVTCIMWECLSFPLRSNRPRQLESDGVVKLRLPTQLLTSGVLSNLSSNLLANPPLGTRFYSFVNR